MSVTPNFSWPLIENTDFVTNLPADFETFADAVDLDLAGLNGGTTGQVLTKDSATDLDFSWTTISAGGMTELATGSLTGSEVSLSSISGSYKDLVLVLRDFYPSADDVLALEFNDTPSVYLMGATLDFTNSTASGGICGITGDVDNRDANNFAIVRIYDYTNSMLKSVQSQYVTGGTNGTGFNIGARFGTARIAAAINKIDIFFGNAPTTTFSGGTYILYGVS